MVFARNPFNRLLPLLALFLCSLLAFASRAAGDEPLAPAPPGDLVRVEVLDENRLQALSRLNLLYYARLTLSTGGEVIYLLADEEVQRQLTQAGFRIQVLLSDATKSSFTLLYSPDVAHLTAQVQSQVLEVRGAYALMRGTPNELRTLEERGAMLTPLHLKPLVVNPHPVPLQLPSTLSADAYIQEMIGKLSSSTLYTLNGNLSGAWAVTIEGNPFTIATRYTYAEQSIKKATRYAYDYFVSLGLPTTFDYYTLYGYQARNVLAQQVGLSQPQRIYLLSAHLDSLSYEDPYYNAPGADDNASGAAALMVIAEVLRAYPFACTLRYALFTGEEQGFFGSEAYAQDIYQNQENLQAVLNLDMIAYNTPNSPPEIELHTRYGHQGDLALARLFRDVVFAYALPLNAVILQDGLSFSDHQSFWNLGYPAILAIEDWQDHTPHYHHTSDRLSTLDMSYYTSFARAALATLAHMGCLMEGTLSGFVREAGSGAPLGGAQVEITSSNGQKRSLTTQADGGYQLPLLIGSYTLKASKTDYQSQTVEDVLIVEDQTITVDFNLPYCPAIQTVDFTFHPSMPLINQIVYFTASAQSSAPLTFHWDFGDGQEASGQEVSHAYTTPAAYTVRLTAGNACSSAMQQHLVPVEQLLHFLPLIEVAQ